MNQGVRSSLNIWRVGVLALLVLLVLNGLQSYRAITELVDHETRASNTKSILRAIVDVFSSVQDAELGFRGYLITGQAEHLQPYYMALEDIRTHIIELKQYHSELPAQAERIEKLEHFIQLRLLHMTNQINIRSNKQSDWVSNVNMSESHASLLQLRALVDEMEEAEYFLLRVQSEEAATSRNKVLITLAVATVAGFVLVVMVALLMRRTLRRQNQEAVRLEQMVELRTRELVRSTQELERSNRELQDFAFVASHDLQEPLRKIRAFGDRLQKQYAAALGDGTDYVERMQNAARRMAQLIDDLLTFSRVTSRTDPFTAVDLNATLQEVLDNLEVRIEETAAQFQVSPLPTLDADASQMKQLLQNLLGNALKFMAADTVPLIRVSAEPIAADAALNIRAGFRIEISDNGIGFDQQFADKIFTPFQRLHGRDEYSGTGIGLAICRRIVERHQGRLTVQSQPGQGSTFTIELPQQHEPAPGIDSPGEHILNNPTD